MYIVRQLINWIKEWNGQYSCFQKHRYRMLPRLSKEYQMKSSLLQDQQFVKISFSTLIPSANTVIQIRWYKRPVYGWVKHVVGQSTVTYWWKPENLTGRCHFEVYIAKRAMTNPTPSHTSEHHILLNITRKTLWHEKMKQTERFISKKVWQIHDPLIKSLHDLETDEVKSKVRGGLNNLGQATKPTAVLYNLF